MRIIKPYFVFENEEEVDEERVLRRLERYGRTCYKSEHKIGPGSAREFVKKIIARGHTSILDHEKVTVRVVCDRGVTHEIVRHRIAAYSQESTRYCNYAKDRFGRDITVIDPFFFDREAETKPVLIPGGPKRGRDWVGFTDTVSLELNEFDVWWLAICFAEWAYMTLVDVFGRSPQEARGVLPNSLKAEIVITYDLTEWRHFFRLRASPRAHPQMQEIAVPMLREFKQRLPTIFADIPLPGEK